MRNDAFNVVTGETRVPFHICVLAVTQLYIHSLRQT